MRQLEKLSDYFEDGVLKLCYEASYIGFSLQRDLCKVGYDCEVIAPGSIARTRGKMIKTDRIDAADLAVEPRYRGAVAALTCYKGIKNLFALTMITELGDIKRFGHPRQIAGWVGMDLGEYSSGVKHQRFGITRQGNAYLRTAFIEANQRGYRSTRISKDLKARRAKSAPEYIAIADRCLHRLNKKGNRMLHAGKHPNKVKVACAREMIGFIWESLNRAAASSDPSVNDRLSRKAA